MSEDAQLRLNGPEEEDGPWASGWEGRLGAPHPPATVHHCPSCARALKWAPVMADNAIDEPWVEGHMAECKHCRLELWWHAPPGYRE